MESWFSLVGLDSRTKQRRFAGLVTRRADEFSLDQVRSRLSRVRRHTLAHLESLRKEFAQQASERGYASIFSAGDAAEAVAFITQVAGRKKALAINRASVIRELKPLLEDSGYKLINTYLREHAREEDAEKVLNHYWQLPFLPAESVYESFAEQKLNPAENRKDLTVLLGVTAAASEDGSVCFLQHTSNVGAMLREAHQLILVVGIEKIVKTREDALFQTKCMGVFGLESILLDLKCPSQSEESEKIDHLAHDASTPEIHIVLLDNGRSKISRTTHFSDVLTCISCRACARNCPTHTFFGAESGNYPKAYLWSFLTGNNRSLELCTGCGMCYLKCPLDINIPSLVSTARGSELTRWPLSVKNRMFHDAWPLMLTASRLAPLTNLFLGSRLARMGMEKAIGLQREAWTPHPHYRTFNHWVSSRKARERAGVTSGA